MTHTSDQFTEQGDLFRFGFTQCGHCGALIRQEDATVKTYYDTSHIQQQEHFCPSKVQPELSCHEKWYLKRLNMLGM